MSAPSKKRPENKKRARDAARGSIKGAPAIVGTSNLALGSGAWPDNVAQSRDRAADDVDRSATGSLRQAAAVTRTVMRAPHMFQGDLDLIELRRRLSIDPDSFPEPPFCARPRSALRARWLAQVSLAFGFSSVVAWGVIEAMAPSGTYPIYPSPSDAAAATTSTQVVIARDAARRTKPILLGVHDQQAPMNEPLALGAVLFGAGQEAIHVSGLIEGSRLSAGEKLGPTGWRVPAPDVAGVLVLPPTAFVGSMNTVIQVRSAGNVPLDTQYARFEWVATSAAAPAGAKTQPGREDPSWSLAAKLDPQRIASLVRRGADLMQNGDFSAARLLLRPAAEAGDPQAALMLGATFDPVIVADQGVIGLTPDPEVARAWYQRAMTSGSTEASARIERLVRMSQ
jgi:hypothetical protein